MKQTSKEIGVDYNYHNILKLRIIRQKKSFFDTYLNKIFSHYKVPSVSDPDLCIFIGDFSPGLENCFIVDSRYYVKKNYIFYENKYKFARWKIEIEGLESAKTNVRIKSNSLGRAVFPGETIYSLIRYKLSQKGYPLIHGSGVGLDGKGCIFSARGGTGKTITAVQLVKKGFDYYSDDSVILGKNELFSFIAPFNLRFNYDVKKLLGIHFSASLRFEIAWKRALYYLTLKRISLFANIHAKDIFRDSIKDKTSISKIFSLTQGPVFCVNKEISRANIAKKLFINIWFESSELIAMQYAYNFVFPDSQLTNFWKNTYASIYENIGNADYYEVIMPPIYSQEIFERFFSECFAS